MNLAQLPAGLSASFQISGSFINNDPNPTDSIQADYHDPLIITDILLTDASGILLTGVTLHSDGPASNYPLDPRNVTGVPLPASAWGGLALVGGLAVWRVTRRQAVQQRAHHHTG